MTQGNGTDSGLAVELRGLRKSFGRLEVLKGIDLDVRHGQVVCIIGPSGSGKSTLLRCVNLLEQPDSGSVKVNGVELNDPDCDLDTARASIGMVFQSFNLFSHLNVLDNLTLAQRKVLKRGKAEAERIGRENLERVGLADKVYAMPSQLSGGQQQRVAIARALAMEPEVLLLDEVTSALDPELVTGVLHLLKDIATTTDITFLCVTHEMQFARDVSDRVMMFDGGKIVEDGPPEKIFTAPENDRTREFLQAVLDRA